MSNKNGKPNIIFIFSDQQRWDTLGCYGQKLDVTPNIDNLAKEGVRFENTFTCQPVCGPARACLQTGKYATQLGCYRNGIGLPIDEKTLAQYLSEVGYRVGYVGKWHLASNGGESANDIGTKVDYETTAIPPERRGGYTDYWVASDLLEFTSHGYGGHMFDENMNKVEFDGYRVDAVTDFALDYIKKSDDDKPFFLFLSFIEPHHQNDNNRYEGPDGSKEKFKNYEIPGDLLNTEGDWRENYPDYLGACNSIDSNVGRIVDLLKEKGIKDDTVIIYTSDHGSHFKTRNRGRIDGYDDYKRSCHDGCTHIPLIIDGPKFKGGKVLDSMVSLIDLPVTILGCAGVDKPKTIEGRDIVKLMDGIPNDWPEEVFMQISESQVGRAIRTKKWKYAVKANGKDGNYYSCSDIYNESFLYDLENDPDEKNNLVSDSKYENIRKQLSQVLIERMKDAGEKEPIILPVKVK